VHVALELSVQAGQIPDCFPYFDGCTSISSTGRHPPGSIWFKALMIPGAVFMAIYWMLMVRWLGAMGDKQIWISRIILSLGLISAVALIFYTVVLGHIGADYRLMRRLGVTIYFGLSYLAQLILTSRLYYFRDIIPGWIFNTKVLVCMGILVWGLLNIFLSAFYEKFDEIENIIEWNIAILNNVFYVLTWFLWRTTAFNIEYKTSPQHKS